MNTTFVLASNNRHKLLEMRRILSSYDITLITQHEAGIDIEVEETGTTFEENAKLKASAAARLSGFPSIADDSGLEVDALGGAPGVYTARYGGTDCVTDEDRYKLLLRNLEGTENRGARFVSCIACVFPDGFAITAEGECRGVIAAEPKGTGGFGYDPVFFHERLGQTFAEMSGENKDQVSHRAKALEIFRVKLSEYYADK